MKLGKPFKDSRGHWRIRWTDENGKRHGKNFKYYQDAAFALRQIEGGVEEIKRGLRSPSLPKKNFNDICNYWIQNRLPQKRNQKDDLSIIRAHLRPFFGNFELKDVNLELIDKFIIQKNSLNRKTVSNILTLLISLLRVAVDLNWILKMPNIKKPKTSLFSHDYYYLKTTEEIARFLNAAKVEGEVVHLMYATAIYTGLRAGELAALKYSDIKFDGSRSLITVQHSFKRRTKSNKVRYVPVLAPLLPLLVNSQNQSIDDLVFPNNKGNMFSESGRIFQETLHRTLKRAGFPLIRINNKIRRYIVFHDLRHTFASHWVMNGGDIFKLQRILGHSNISMTMRYAHLAPDAFANDFERLGKIESRERNIYLLNTNVPISSTEY